MSIYVKKYVEENESESDCPAQSFFYFSFGAKNINFFKNDLHICICQIFFVILHSKSTPEGGVSYIGGILYIY